MEKFASARVGDKVWDMMIGWGVIDNVDLNPRTPINVVFDDESSGSYRLDGRVHEDFINPVLFWRPFEVPKEEGIGLRDKDLVWCWDNKDTAAKLLGFYNSADKKNFCWQGTRYGRVWDNYELYVGVWPEWAKLAVKTLEE
jgi:hypothetical protein